MSSKGSSSDLARTPLVEEEAAATFIRRLYGDWSDDQQSDFEKRLADNEGFAHAYRRVDESWRALDRHAEAPELMAYRAEAIEIVRRANARRWWRPGVMPWLTRQWKVAAALVGLALLGTIWQISAYGYHPGDFHTAIGEQRIVELDDHTRITIDAATRLQVRFTSDSRNVRLLEGQAQFSVAKDPSRPFKVIAGDRAIVAVGTVFTVEYLQRRVRVAMLEGKVAVLASKNSTAASQPGGKTKGRDAQRDSDGTHSASEQEREEIFLTAGEELQVAQDGNAVVTPDADLEAITAWREGKVILRTEPLGEAVDRMNRYSHLQIKIEDESLGAEHISGVFEAGDTRGFVSALERYFFVTADYSDPDTVRISSK